MDSIRTKACVRCHVEKANDLTAFPANKTAPSGIATMCRACAVVATREYRAAQKAAVGRPALVKQTGEDRECRKCKQLKPSTVEFYDVRHNSKFRGWSFECKACIRAKLEVKRSFISRSPTDVQVLWGCKACGESKPRNATYFYTNRYNLDGLDGTCKRCRISKNSLDLKKRPKTSKYYETRRALRHKRRALKVNAPGQHKAADIAKQLKDQKGKCYWCQQKLPTDQAVNYHVDHLIPLSKGGSDGPENLVCACAACNLSKGAKLPHEWIGRLI